jgi:hypothetical protein
VMSCIALPPSLSGICGLDGGDRKNSSVAGTARR